MTADRNAQLVAAGAEANVAAGIFLGRPVLVKRRVVKGYRDVRLDNAIRAERTRLEGHLLVAARRAGVPVPVVFDVDRATAAIVLEHVAGRTLQEALTDDNDAAATSRMRALGTAVARLHDAGLAHGDLTTRNVLAPDAQRLDLVVLIDFGLGAFAEEAEERGVDLHLLEEALEATEARSHALFAAFLETYRLGRTAHEALVRLDRIRERGRYR